MKDRINEAVAVAEEDNGSITGYALLVFHSDGSATFDALADENDESALEIIAELASCLDDEVVLQ